MTTIVEFLLPLRDDSARNKILAVMYYSSKYGGKKKEFTIDEIREFLKEARVQKVKQINISDVLGKAVPYVQPRKNTDGYLIWSLTATGVAYLEGIIGLESSVSEIKHDAGSLHQLLKKITDQDVRDYIEESIKCLEVGALRASVVFLWSGAIRTLQSQMLLKSAPNLNVAIAKYDPKARKIKTIDDFAYFKDSTLLLCCQDLGILDKNERSNLENALNLRNDCGHPGKYNPGPKKVAAYIEDIMGIIFT